jgi:hypothetical protein
VDALSSKLKPAVDDPDEGDEEPIGDVDLFCLADDDAGAPALRVHPKWMGHLQSRVLGADGQPRRAAPGEDPSRLGLVLEWVYGTIVSTAEKSRDSAHRPLGGRLPSAEGALQQLASALSDQVAWEGRARVARDMLARLLDSRREAAELAERYDTRPVAPLPPPPPAEGAAPAPPPAPLEELPDHVVLAMLRREVLLTSAKLHFLAMEQLQADRALRSHKAQLRRGEPEFERLKRELEELKSGAPRGLEGTYRTAAEMERHRSQLADAAIEEQIEVQAAFRETGSRLQRVLDLRRETEVGMARREGEMKQLNGWRANVQGKVAQLEGVLAVAAPLEAAAAAAAADGPDLAALSDEVDEEAGEVDAAQRALVAAVKSVTRQGEELRRVRDQFQRDMRRQLYTADDDLALFDLVKRQLVDIERRLDDGRAALLHLETFAINVACDDPGTAIGTQLILPFLQDRLDARALEHAAQRAAAAEDEVIRMEVRGRGVGSSACLCFVFVCCAAERTIAAKMHAPKEPLAPLLPCANTFAPSSSQLDSVNKERLEREKKAKAKARAKEKVRSERDKERAEREERARAEAAEAEAAAAARAADEAAARARRAEELEQQRRAEEEVMERRRQELLSDENSHWRQRHEQAELMAAQAELEQALRAQAADGGAGLEDSASDGDGFVSAAPKPLRRPKQEAVRPRAERAPQARPLEGARPRALPQRDGRPAERPAANTRRAAPAAPLTLPLPLPATKPPGAAPTDDHSPPAAPPSPVQPGGGAAPPPPTPQDASAPASPVRVPPAPGTPDGQPTPALLPPFPQGMLPPGMMHMPPHAMGPPPAAMGMLPMPAGAGGEEERRGGAGAGGSPPPGRMPGGPMPPPPHMGMPPFGGPPFPPHPHMGRGPLPPGALPPGVMFFPPMGGPGGPMPHQVCALLRLLLHPIAALRRHGGALTWTSFVPFPRLCR